VVALVRDDQVIASPDPAQDLRAHDVLVVIGTTEGIDKARALLGAS
jgi:TrkA domain protein